MTVRWFGTAVVLLLGCASAATLQVTPGGTIQSAVDRANAGDTILIHTGTYRERVKVDKALTIAAAPGESVVLTGADVIPAPAWEKMPDKPIWRHTPWTYHGPTHPNDERHRLIGRTEQVIADGQRLKQ